MTANEEENVISASDLLKLMNVVEAATSLYNVCELTFGARWGVPEFHELGEALRAFGLSEVTND